MSAADPLRTVLPLLRPRLRLLLLAVTLGALSLGSALALAAVSAWLITRAWQMPPVLDLSVAVVAVRTFGISRGVLGYIGRLVSHETSLRAGGEARSELYRRLTHGPARLTARLHSGDLLARVGSDVDTLADVLARALVPIGVAVVLGLGSVTLIAMISPAAAALLAVCMVIAGGLAPWLSARAARAEEQVARRHHAQRDIAAITALDHAPELRVAGRLPALIAESGHRQRQWGRSIDRAVAPMAVAAAVPGIAVGVSTIGAILIGILIAPTVSPTTLAVLMLFPLSAFEAIGVLPAAAVALVRARIAGERLTQTAPAPASPAPRAVPVMPSAAAPRLAAAGLCAGFGGSPAGQPVTIGLRPGDRLVVSGGSGVGKTALLMTLAGMLRPRSGEVILDDIPIDRYPEAQQRGAVCYFAEDAHVFATTVRDNLLVARGDCSDDELVDAVRRVGLGDWLHTLPEGLSTVLAGGVEALSAGQRRRLLLARALLCPAPVLLLDEPTEHLDAVDGSRLLGALLDPAGSLLEPARTVVVATHEDVGQFDCQRIVLTAASTAGSGAPGATPSPVHPVGGEGTDDRGGAPDGDRHIG